MATLLNLKSIRDSRGSLTVLDNVEEWLPFPVKRIFFIQHAKDSTRGGHRHFFTKHTILYIIGSCIVTIHNGEYEHDILLDSADQCLIIDSDDWHTMHHFSSDAVLLALASTNYDPTDYIYEPYQTSVASVDKKK